MEGGKNGVGHVDSKRWVHSRALLLWQQEVSPDVLEHHL